MKSSIKPNRKSEAMGLLATLLIAVVVGLGSTASVLADLPTKIFPPNSIKYGNDYAGWSAAWWQWALGLPVDGHPFLDTPDFDVSAGQTGDVWFLATVFGTVERTCTIPAGKALFMVLANAECSTLEPDPFHGDTAKEQRTCAKFWADPIVNPSCEIDGVAVTKISSYRVTSPQFTFTALTPWIFGDVGGTGTAVGDGYYVFVAPFSPGEHTVHLHGEIDGSTLDMTYHLTVE